MYESSKIKLRIILNALIILCVAAGVGIFIFISDIASVMSYFTIQSNLLCLIAGGVTLTHIIKKNPVGNAYIFFKGMSLVSILLTFFIYNFVLKQYLNISGNARGESLESILLHIAAPLMMLCDFIFFEEKECFKKWHPFGWTAFPFFYIAYTAVFKALGGTYQYFGGESKFPYFFLDYETYGIKTAGLWMLLITIGYIGFSYLLIGFGKLLSKIKKR